LDYRSAQTDPASIGLYSLSLNLQDELMKLTSEHETRTLSANELEKEIEEMQKVCESLKSEIKKQDEQKADLEKKAKNNYLGLEHEVSIIGKQNKTLYLITRLTWDDKAMKKDLNLIKGFVFNKTNNDVSVFETDPKKTNNKTIVSDLLWDYIGAGISQEWKKGKDWKM
jgi:septal ring factor EnvC (AmiA/AmiB activator)